MESSWREVEFSKLCDIWRGGSPRPIHDWLASSGIPWVKISDASAAKSRFIDHTGSFIRPEGLKKSRPVIPGDLILSNSATPGLPMFMGIAACIHDGWLLLRNFRGIDKLFCYYLLLHERERIVQKGSGTVFTNLKTDILKNHVVTIPPLNEQRAIAHVLGTLDDKIELNRKMNQTLEGIARAIFKSWFVDFDPVRAKAAVRKEHPEWSNEKVSRAACPNLKPEIAELFPDSFVDSELGEIPKGWLHARVADCFDLKMGQSPPGRTYNEEEKGTPFYQGRRDFGERFPSRRVFCTEPTRFAERGDTLVSVRAPVGDLNMANERCAIGRGLAAIRHKSGSSSFTYYSMVFLADHLGKYEAEGTVFGAINRRGFESIPVVAPTDKVILGFDGLVSPLDDRIGINEAQNLMLRGTRDALLPRLISGELRTPNTERM